VSFKIDAWLTPNVPYPHKSFWTHPMLLPRDETLVDAHFGPSIYSAKQDRCTICVERTTGSKIILDAPDGTPR
jgi:hypothetical protein